MGKSRQQRIIEQLVDFWMKQGMDEKDARDMVEGIGKLRPGTTYGHVHISDVAEIAQRAIYTLGHQAITLKVSKHGDAETYDGHIDIQVLAIEE